MCIEHCLYILKTMVYFDTSLLNKPVKPNIHDLFFYKILVCFPLSKVALIHNLQSIKQQHTLISSMIYRLQADYGGFSHLHLQERIKYVMA